MAAESLGAGADLDPGGEAFEWVAPLGSSCLTALWLQKQELRKFSLPFDWTFSSLALVRDCLGDDFKSFLEPREYVAIGRHGAGCGHRRYTALRTPGRWKHHVFLHHDPSRKRADQDYLGRCVRRFRQLLAAPGRKLLLHCALVQEAAAVEATREQTLRGARAGEAAEPTWAHCSEAEAHALFQALRDAGASDFRLVVVTLVAGDASEARAAPEARCRAQVSSGRESLAIFELHLVKGELPEDDHFRVLAEPENERCFRRAVFGERALSECFALRDIGDGYQPSGYRDTCEQSAKESNAAELCAESKEGLTCSWCGAAGFQSRNRLFAHIRGAPRCASLAAEAAALKATPSGQALEFAFSVGYASGPAAAIVRLRQGLELSGATDIRVHLIGGAGAAAEAGYDLGDGGDTADRREEADEEAPSMPDAALAAVGDVCVLSCVPARIGEALQESLRQAATAGDLALHGLVRLRRGSAAELAPELGSALRSFLYLLPLAALGRAGAEAPGGCPGAGEADAAATLGVCKDFKAVLRDLLRHEQAAPIGGPAGQEPLERLRMTGRVTAAGHECVVLRIAAAGLPPDRALGLVARAVAARRGQLTPAAVPEPLPCAPACFLALERCGFRAFERRHGPLLGPDAEPRAALDEWWSGLAERMVTAGRLGERGGVLEEWLRLLDQELC